MSMTDKVATIAENVPKVYEAGKKAGNYEEWNKFWDNFQDYGNATGYTHIFRSKNWNDENFKPKYSIVPSASNFQYTFYQSGITNLAQILEKCNVALNIENVTLLYYSFASSAITHIPTLNAIKCNNFQNMCNGCANLLSIEKIIVNKDLLTNSSFTGCFTGCYALEEIRFEGEISCNGLNLQWSTKLSHDSLMNILNCLQDKTNDASGTVWKVTVGAGNVAKLTETEKEIAHNKGWVVE